MVKDRLIEFLEYKGLSQAKFAEKIGVSKGYVNNMTENPTQETIMSIKNNFPELNTEWLLTGKGEMINNQQIGNVSESTVVGANVNGNWNNIVHNNFKEMIELQKGYQDLLRKKDDHISELLGIINKITN
ncbi:MAG: helix-turn-helix transcriptional regulator [Bacteroidales bacterium]|nr:helix-turn-helix transcriptional regulator [Bacteroidales bacterium]